MAGNKASTAYLAGQVADWFVLYTYRRHGLKVALEVLSYRGGSGTDATGTFRAWQTTSGGRKITLHIGGFDAPAVTIRTADVLDHAAAHLDATDWARLDELVAARGAALNRAEPTPDVYRRRTFRPAELTAQERATIAAAEAERAEVEKQMRVLVRARLRAGLAARLGAQLSLFEESA